MKGLLALSFWLAAIFVASISAAPASLDPDLPSNVNSIAGYDPSTDYHGYATAEIWMGRLRTNISDVTGAALYLKMYEQIQKRCYGRRPKCSPAGQGDIPTHLVHSKDKVAESISDSHRGVRPVS
jgi:hypothetical protein